MSVLIKQMIVLKHVQTILEATFVDVIVALIWMMMGLLVMVCIQTCPYMTDSVILMSLLVIVCRSIYSLLPSPRSVGGRVW